MLAKVQRVLMSFGFIFVLEAITTPHTLILLFRLMMPVIASFISIDG